MATSTKFVGPAMLSKPLLKITGGSVSPKLLLLPILSSLKRKSGFLIGVEFLVILYTYEKLQSIVIF